MMTAAQIAKGLGQSKIRINYLYTEHMANHIFEENPLEDTTIKHMEKKNVVEKYLDGVDFVESTDHFEYAMKLYPESKRHVLERTHKIIEDFQ
jgi:hypothetical protein